MITFLTRPLSSYPLHNMIARVSFIIASLLYLPSSAVLAQNPFTEDNIRVSSSAVSSNTSSNIPLRFALLTFEDKQNTQRLWQPIIQLLENQLNQSSEVQQQYRMTLEVYYLDELAKIIEQGRADVVLTQPSQYLTFAQQNKLSTPLASLLRREANQVTDRFGGVIFTRADRHDINDLEQLKDKSIAITHLNGLGSYQMQAFELKQKAIPLTGKMRLIEIGLNQSDLVEFVLSGQADVGFVRTGVLEKMAHQHQLNWADIKLVGAQKFADFPLLTSTRLYPEWPVATLKNIDRDTQRRLAIALLSLTAEDSRLASAGIAGFSSANSYHEVETLLTELQHATDSSIQTQLQRVITETLGNDDLVPLILALLVIGLFALLLMHRHRDLKRARYELAQQNQRLNCLNLAIEQSPEMIMITDRQAKIEYANPATELITGYAPSEIIGKKPNLFQSGLTDIETYHSLWQKISLGEIWAGELTNRRKNGEIYYTHTVISPVKNEQQHITHYLAIERDVTREKKDQSRIHHLLYKDTLTGLGNRSQLIETLDALLKSYQEHPKDGHLGCLMFLNIDHFKWINKIHGVTTGDQLLVSFANRLADFVDESGIAVRMVDDEFAILLTLSEHWQDNEDWLLGWEERLQKNIHKPFKIGDDVIDIHCSIGMTYTDLSELKTNRIDTINQFFGQAAIALKLAQKRGGNRLEVFKEEMAKQDLERHLIEQELQHAIHHNELRLYLQPQYDEQGLIGAECLIRWMHPIKGLIPPGVFISVAEQSDLIIGMSDWVLEQACAVLSRLQEEYPDFTLSVNISPRHFLQPSFVEGLMKTVNQHRTNPKQLVLEITEGLFLENLDEVVTKMKQIKALGFSFSIDDFGTGYSSLSYLKQLPIDELKIDRSFVIALEEQGLSQSLVETIYAVATQMQLRVVAEGVETNEQANLLNTLPAIVQQGYLHGKPDLAEHWLERWQSKPEPSTELASAPQ